MKKVRVVSLACDTPTGPPLHFYKTLSKYVLGYQSYGYYYEEESESCLSYMRHTYWSSSSTLPNIIILSQSVWELWPAQDFGFRGDNYITRKVRVVSLSRDTPNGPPLHPYIIKLSQTVWELWPAQDFGFRGDNYITKTVRVVSFARLLVLLYIPTKYYQSMSKDIKVMERTRMRLQFLLQGR